MHAMTILVYYHSWACFCLANGLKLESEMNFFDKEKLKSSQEEKSPQQEPHEPSTFFVQYFFKNFLPENEEIYDMLNKLSEESQIEDVNGVNANELRKKDKVQLHFPQEMMFESTTNSMIPPQDQSPKDDVSGVGYFRYLADEIGKNEDFNYHKYTLLKSHVKFCFRFVSETN